MVLKLNEAVQEKFDRLVEILQQLDEVVVAMSGGVDSVLLAQVAFSVLGNRARAITADSPSLPRRELNQALALAEQIGIPHQVIQTHEMDDPAYAANTPERCYFCKTHILEMLEQIKTKTGAQWVVFGENVDDQSDYRPGSRAAKEHGVRAPLREASLGKAEIRQIAKAYGLPNWERPASACLSSRIPYGQSVTPEKLQQIEQAEEFLYSLGMRGHRVRHHGDIARLEAAAEQMPLIVEHAAQVNAAIQKLGFTYITLDLGGYRRGSLNIGLSENVP